MSLIWVTGNAGVGKSTVCELLKRRGHTAVDADWEGYNYWVDRTNGQIVASPPYPVPSGWLDHFGWRIARVKVQALAMRSSATTVFLCGYVENEDEVRDLFDLVVCLVVDEETLTRRLADRTTNAFGSQPEELAAALQANKTTQAVHQRSGASIIDATQPVASVTDAVLAAAGILQ